MVCTKQGDVKNSMGNGEAKELICMIHGRELRLGTRNAGGRAASGLRGRKGSRNGTTVIA